MPPDPHAARRALPAFAALSAAYFAALGLFNLYAPLWFKSWGLGPLGLGVLAAVPSLTRLLGPYLWGWWADRHGERVRWIRRACAATWVLALLYLWPVPGLPLAWQAEPLFWLAAITAGVFLSNAGIMPLGEAVVSQIVSADGALNAGAYGRVRVWGSVGFLCSVLGFGVWFEHMGVGTFAPALLLIFTLVWATSYWTPLQHDGVRASQEEAMPSMAPVLARPEFRWALAGIVFTVLAHMALYAFLSLYLTALGHGPAVIGAAWGVSVAVEIVWFWFQGRWFGTAIHPWLIATSLVSAFRFALTAAAGMHLWVLLLAQALHALSFAAQHTASVALIQQHFPGRLRARGQALYSAVGYGVPGVLGSLGGGWLAQHLGYQSIFWAASASALIGAMCAWRAMKMPNLLEK
ncbi:MFS transporter [Leptothrix ochracea]|uniref:MFS transporter n=1 Tax=Leptothrix ochracea TaxID=735331 RepID=UPI0034E23267